MNKEQVEQRLNNILIDSAVKDNLVTATLQDWLTYFNSQALHPKHHHILLLIIEEHLRACYELVEANSQQHGISEAALQAIEVQSTIISQVLRKVVKRLNEESRKV